MILKQQNCDKVFQQNSKLFVTVNKTICKRRVTENYLIYKKHAVGLPVQKSSNY